MIILIIIDIIILITNWFWRLGFEWLHGECQWTKRLGTWIPKDRRD